MDRLPGLGAVPRPCLKIKIEAKAGGTGVVLYWGRGETISPNAVSANALARRHRCRFVSVPIPGAAGRFVFAVVIITHPRAIGSSYWPAGDAVRVCLVRPGESDRTRTLKRKLLPSLWRIGGGRAVVSIWLVQSVGKVAYG